MSDFSVSVAGVQPRAKKHSMHILLALLYASLVAAPECLCLSAKGDFIINTTHVIIIAKTTLIHINTLRRSFPVAAQMEVATPSIEGLTSIITYLERLDSELQNPATEVLSQIQADVSSLNGFMLSLARIKGCPIQAKTKGEALSHSDRFLFPESYLNRSLMKVQRYLEKFLHNMDKLKVC